MKTTLTAGIVCLAINSGAQAQQAVQWKVSDGGNGHWYGVLVVPGGVSWSAAKSLAEGRAGILACAESQGELAYIQSQFAPARVPQAWVPQNPWNDFTFGPWLGAYQEPSSPEPGGGWKWITGASFVPSGPYFNNDACGIPEDRLHLYYSTDGYVGLNDMPDAPVPSACGPSNPSLLIEWFADCNNDGIVDYGQILQGQLADTDTNGIPDICEGPTCREADLYRNNRIDGADLGILLSEWGPATPSTNSDINHDGFVNGADLGIMLSFWGACPN